MLAINVTDRENYLSHEIQENSIICTESEQKAAPLAQWTFFQQHSLDFTQAENFCAST